MIVLASEMMTTMTPARALALPTAMSAPVWIVAGRTPTLTPAAVPTAPEHLGIQERSYRDNLKYALISYRLFSTNAISGAQ